ncbi:MAG: hypothetical protein DCF15_21265 [Phormidesmis priestleyi]|uniref:Uncharacterized protein n=1 Tax=Phormidesmis priestleyi TaxID=268141 RepID=A0A2W4WML1_9CYAN|nr:MAG: hypothetical protein DCF15_21265 [Phormidesmis priestleyi]
MRSPLPSATNPQHWPQPALSRRSVAECESAQSVPALYAQTPFNVARVTITAQVNGAYRALFTCRFKNRWVSQQLVVGVYPWHMGFFAGF